MSAGCAHTSSFANVIWNPLAMGQNLGLIYISLYVKCSCFNTFIEQLQRFDCENKLFPCYTPPPNFFNPECYLRESFCFAYFIRNLLKPSFVVNIIAFISTSNIHSSFI